MRSELTNYTCVSAAFQLTLFSLLVLRFSRRLAPFFGSPKVGLIMKDIRSLRQAPAFDMLGRQIGRTDGADSSEGRYRSSAGGVVRGGSSSSNSLKKICWHRRRHLPAQGLGGDLLADGLADHCSKAKVGR